MTLQSYPTKRTLWLCKTIAVVLTMHMVNWPAGYAGSASTAVAVQSVYDGNGNVVTRTDGNGAVTSFSYDAVNRLTSIDYPGGSSPDVSFTFDVNGNRTAMVDATGKTEYAYDLFDRLIDVRYPDGGFVTYGYDNVGNVTTLRYGNTKTAKANSGYTELAYTYDEDNRMATVTDVLSNTTTSYTYDDAGHPLRRTLPNGVTTDYGYDGDGRLISVDHNKADGTRVCKYDYTLNAIGNRTQAVETLPDGTTKTTSYTYDALDRLSNVAYPDARSVAYVYDSFGNRTEMTEVTSATTKVTDYTYDNDSRLLSTKVDGVADEAFTYDATGNLIQRVRASDNRQIDYAYDFENRLARYFDGTNNVQYVYDGLGDRVAKVVNGVRINFVNDTNRKYAQVLDETDTNGNAQKVYEWGNELIGQQAGATRGYHLLDSTNGSVRRLVNIAGIITNSYEYDAFGFYIPNKEGISNNYQFDAECQEKEAGLLFLRSRFMDVKLGRFLTRDKMGSKQADPQTYNQYIFAKADPVNRIDPSGQASNPNDSLFQQFGDNFRDERATNGSEARGLAAIGIAGITIWATAGTAVEYGALINGAAETGNALRSASIWGYDGTSIANQFMAESSGKLLLGNIVDKATEIGTAFPAVVGLGTVALYDTLAKPSVEHWYSDFDNWLHPDLYVPFRPSSNVGNYDYFSTPGWTGDLPGGVALDKSASVLLDINNITGGTYDPTTGQIILFGTKDTSATALPKISLDDLAVALRAKQLGSFPVVSIDPPTVSSPPEWPGRDCFTVRYGDYYTDPLDGQTKVLDVSSKTRFGWVMFEADRLMKSLTLGKDSITQQAISSKVAGYADLLTRIKRNRNPYQGNLAQRFWFEPSEIVLQPSTDGKSMQITKAAMQLSTEAMYASQGQVEGIPEAEDFASWFTTNYDAVADEQVSTDPNGQPCKIYKELKQLAYVAGIVRWIDDYKVPVDLAFLQGYQPAAYQTPTVTPETSEFTAYHDKYGAIRVVTLSGGVTFCNDLSIDSGGNPSGLGAAATAARPAETSLGWTFSSGGNTYNATAFSVDRTQKDGGISPTAVDAQFQVNGAMPLMLGRYFNSSNITQTLFGWGWQAQPYALEFKGNREMFSLCHQTWSGYGELWFRDRASKGAYKYVPSGFYDKTTDPQHLASRFDPKQDILVYQYESKTTPGLLYSDNATRMTMRLDNGTLLDFNFDGILTQVEDRNGNKIVYGYDSSKRLVSISQPLGKTITLAYDAANRVESATLPDGRSVTYSYDANNNLTSAQVSSPTGRYARYAYDASHNLTQLQDEDGKAAATQSFDVYGRLTGITQPGVTTPFAEAYNLTTRISDATGPEGVSRTTIFDSDNDPISFTDARSETSAMTYNGYRDMTSITTPDDQTKQFYVDAAGHRIATVMPNGRADCTFFDSFGNPTATFHASADATFTGLFDADHIFTGNEISAYSTDNTEYDYDAKGNPLSVTDANAHTRTFGYDAQGKLISSKDARGKESTLSYDTSFRLAKTHNALGQEVNAAYDIHDNLTQLSTLTGTVDYVYNAKNQATSMTTGDASARNTYSYTYDAKAHLSTVTDPSGYVTEYGYDDRGNLLEIKHDGIVRFSYDYDGLNRATNTFYTGTSGGARARLIPISPAGSERLSKGAPIVIRWFLRGDWTNSPNITIQYSLNGTKWIDIATVDAASGIYSWNDAPTGNAIRIRFVGTGGNAFAISTTTSFSVGGAQKPDHQLWKGSYVGILKTDDTKYDGLLKMSVKSTGKYAATLKMNGHTYLWSGAFDNNGAATKKIPTSTLTAKLNIGLQTGEITGTLLDGANKVTDISLSRTTIEAATIAPYKGSYTFIFRPDASDTTAPQGEGYGTMLVSKNGLITASGLLADGTKFSGTAALTQDAGWTLYVQLYKKKGFLSGLVTIDPAASDALSGTLVWVKPGSKAKLYPSGFTTALTLTGGTYDAATFDFTVLNGTTLALSGGGLTSPISITLGSGVKIKKTASYTDATTGTTMTINLSTGVIQGKYLPSKGAAKLPINGVILQNQDSAEGFFLNPTESGLFELNAP